MGLINQQTYVWGPLIVVIWYVSINDYLVPCIYHKPNSFVSHEYLILVSVFGGSPQESYVC